MLYKQTCLVNLLIFILLHCNVQTCIVAWQGEAPAGFLHLRSTWRRRARISLSGGSGREVEARAAAACPVSLYNTE